MTTVEGDIKNFFLAVSFFLAFAGYYIVLMVMTNIGLQDQSRLMTVPIRIIIIGCLFLAYLSRPKVKFQNGLLYFLCFSFFYFLRIGLEILDATSQFHLSETEILLYFTSFVFLPILFISQITLSRRNYRLVFYAIVIGCLLMSLGTILFYRNLIGEVSRISHTEEVTINPLALSYTSAMGMGLSIGYLLTNKVTLVKRVLLYACIISCLVPFFLGASRGSIIALFLPFVFYFIFQKGIKRKIWVIFALIILAAIFMIAVQYLGMGIFNRLINTTQATEFESASRMVIWEEAFLQFLEDPLFGNSLEARSIDKYPHNIFIEVLITTGIIGFIPFVLFMAWLFSRSAKIIKYDPRSFFLVVIFIQGFSARMVSGSIYTSSWLAIGAGLIIGYNYKNANLNSNS